MFRKVAIYIIVLLVCTQLVLQVFAQKTIEAEFCRVVDSSEHDGKVVRTSSFLYVSPEADDFFYSTECNSGDYFASVDFSNLSNSKISITQLERLLNKSSSRVLSVVVEGKLTNTVLLGGGHFGVYRAKFEVQNIISIKALPSSAASPRFNKDTPIIDDMTSLKSVNTEILFALYGREDWPIENVSSETEMFLNGQLSDVESLKQLLFSNRNTLLVVTAREITRHEKEWRIKGYIGNRLDNVWANMSYDNTYTRESDNSWKLIEARLSQVNKKINWP